MISYSGLKTGTIIPFKRVRFIICHGYLLSTIYWFPLDEIPAKLSPVWCKKMIKLQVVKSSLDMGRLFVATSWQGLKDELNQRYFKTSWANANSILECILSPKRFQVQKKCWVQKSSNSKKKFWVLSWLDLPWLDLLWLDLSWLYLSLVALSWVDLSWLDLPWLDLSWLDLSWLYLSLIALSWGTCHNLTCPDLNCPYLTCPNLTCPDLNCPDLTCPDLTCTDLTYPDFTSPDLPEYHSDIP